jgi:hypothetical protein
VAPRFFSSPRPFRHYQTRKKEAERRQPLFNNLRTSGCGSHPFGCARLSAFHHGSHQRDLSSLRLNFRPGFLGRGLNGRYPPSPVPVQGAPYEGEMMWEM